MRKIIGWLSEEDLELYRRVATEAQVALSAPRDLSYIESAELLIKDWEFFGELRKRYDIPDDEEVGFALYDGAIYEAND